MMPAIIAFIAASDKNPAVTALFPTLSNCFGNTAFRI